MAMTTEVFVYDAVRTPFGRYGGALAGTRPDDLAALVVRTIAARAPALEPGQVDEIFLGNANGAGEDNRNVARMAGLLAGLPTSVPATTVNRLCGSSLDATMIASRQIALGEADVVIAGGVESMSRAPWVLLKPEKPYPAGNETLISTTLGWRLVNPAMPDAWDGGFYDDLVVAVPGVGLKRDESIRTDTSLERLAGLKPVFRADGTVTAGNASPLNDGASAAMLGSPSAAKLTGLEPMARIAGRGASATDPQFFGFAPVEAANTAVKRADISWADVGAVELNEAFAAQSVACVKAWGVDPAIVNAYGGAIAIGHPLGASGTRILGTLAKTLVSTGERWGVAAICIGVGQGLAVVLENARI
jgi:acetyl-CoA acetyltransferase